MTLETKTLQQQYRVKAHSIGDNAIRLVDEFFKSGIDDDIEYSIGGSWVKCKHYKWTLTDLDRALDEMGRSSINNTENLAAEFIERNFISSSDAIERAVNEKQQWSGLKS